MISCKALDNQLRLLAAPGELSTNLLLVFPEFPRFSSEGAAGVFSGCGGGNRCRPKSIPRRRILAPPGEKMERTSRLQKAPVAVFSPDLHGTVCAPSFVCEVGGVRAVAVLRAHLHSVAPWKRSAAKCRRLCVDSFLPVLNDSLPSGRSITA